MSKQEKDYGLIKTKIKAIKVKYCYINVIDGIPKPSDEKTVFLGLRCINDIQGALARKFKGMTPVLIDSEVIEKEYCMKKEVFVELVESGKGEIR